MYFRLANMEDLMQIKSVYKEIIKNMNDNKIKIWDEVYPCDFFEEDIKQKRLYVLLDEDTVVSAFALCDTVSGAERVNWESNTKRVVYIERLGVNVDYIKKGIATFMLRKAKDTAKKLGAEYLRLFVIENNAPAIRLYQKNNFTRLPGIYDEIIDENLVFHEYAYEVKLV